MDFVIRDIDPPGWSFALTVKVLLALGVLLGFVSVLVRVAQRRVGSPDAVAWGTGLLLGVALGFVTNNQVSSVAFLAIAVCMGAGTWIAARSDVVLRAAGLRLLEGAAVTTVAALWAGRL